MNMINRVIKAAMLDVQFFNEAERDTSLNTEALLVVIIVSIAGGIGAFVGSLFNGEIGAAVLALIVAAVLGVVNYYIWAYVTYFIGTNLFEGTADPRRTAAGFRLCQRTTHPFHPHLRTLPGPNAGFCGWDLGIDSRLYRRAGGPGFGHREDPGYRHCRLGDCIRHQHSRRIWF